MELKERLEDDQFFQGYNNFSFAYFKSSSKPVSSLKNW